MKYFLIALGSRGDVEPFIAVAEILLSQDHEVHVLFPEQFRKEVSGIGLTFHSYGTEFLDQLNRTDAQRLIEGPGNALVFLKNFRSAHKHYKSIEPNLRKIEYDLLQSIQVDIVVYHPLCIYPLIWSMSHPSRSICMGITAYIVVPTFDRTAIGFYGNYNLGKWLNAFSYKVLHVLTILAIKDTYKQLGLKAPVSLNYSSVYQFVTNIQKTIFFYSPNLIPKPSHWGSQVSIHGNIERKSTVGDPIKYKPVLDFLNKYDKVLYLSFGSMIHSDHQKVVDQMMTVILKHKIPTVLNLSAYSPQNKISETDFVFFTDYVPHRLIFPKIHVVIHHGGAGTTHMALKNNCISLIIHHFFDQPFYAQLLAKKELGPKGILLKKVHAANFEKHLLDAWNNPVYAKNVAFIASKMQDEFSEEALLQKLQSV